MVTYYVGCYCCMKKSKTRAKLKAILAKLAARETRCHMANISSNNKFKCRRG